MARSTWIKLYVELLDDEKLGTLPEFMKWRAVELFLVAGEKRNDGLLPPVERLAWRLRLSDPKIEETLAALAEIGVVHETPQGWMVTHFKERQYSESYERVRRFRERYRNGGGNAEVAAEESTSSSASDSGLDSDSGSSGEGVQGEGIATPETPVEALSHPDLQVFQRVTGGRLPAPADYRQVISVVRHLREAHGPDDPALEAYLKRFWQAWSRRTRKDGRKYGPGNLAWLTEWAFNGSIPAGRAAKPAVKTQPRGKEVEQAIKEFYGRS